MIKHHRKLTGLQHNNTFCAHTTTTKIDVKYLLSCTSQTTNIEKSTKKNNLGKIKKNEGIEHEVIKESFKSAATMFTEKSTAAYACQDKNPVIFKQLNFRLEHMTQTQQVGDKQPFQGHQITNRQDTKSRDMC
jgi:hypothetical protein